MANNRMYIVHRKTGKAFAIAKRYGVAWMSSYPELDKFFDQCFAATEFDGRDDFEIRLEDNEEAPHIPKE